MCHITNQLSVSLMSSICLMGLSTLNVCCISHWGLSELKWHIDDLVTSVTLASAVMKLI